MRKVLWGACLVLSVLSVLVAGCGQPIENNAPASPGDGSAHPAPSAGGVAVLVTMKEWSMALEPGATKAGTVTLKIVNAGSQPHGVYVEGPGVDRKGPLVSPGESAELSLDLPAGECTLFDFVRDNESAHGMRATLTVR